MESKNLSALILAGGLGIRMRPLTISIPKPLLPIGDKSILEDIIIKLSNQKIKNIYIALNYKGEMIESLIGSGSRYRVKIHYLKEKVKLGTVGPIKLIKKLPENLLVINGDIKTNLNFSNFYNWHIKNKSNLTVAIKKINFQHDFGVIESNRNNIVKYSEKPKSSFYVSTGIYILNKSIGKLIPYNENYGLDKLVSDCIIKKKKTMSYKLKEKWKDIGSFSSYFDAIKK